MPLTSVPRLTTRTNISFKSTGSLKTSNRLYKNSATASTWNRHWKNEFAKYYLELCRLQHIHPLQFIQRQLDNAALDVACDRIKLEDWIPLLTALSSDRSLLSLTFRLLNEAKEAVESADTELKAKALLKIPVVITKFVLLWLVNSIKNCLSQSGVLTVLQLEGLPLRGEYFSVLVHGLSNSKGLRHLSLSRTHIGDEGAGILCVSVRNLKSLVTLDLSECDLTDTAASAVAQLIAHQKLIRYNDIWQDSLRHRDPDVEAMTGLRRITLNDNTQLGNKGVQNIAEELKDDLWFRALDVQNTGLTEEGSTSLIQLVQSNPHIVIVDARRNTCMPEAALTKILALLAVNNADSNESTYKWINKVPENNKPGLKRNQNTLGKIPKWKNDSKILENEILKKEVMQLSDLLKRKAQQSEMLIRENRDLRNQLLEAENEKKGLTKACKKAKKRNREAFAAVESTVAILTTMSKQLGANEKISSLFEKVRSILDETRGKSRISENVEKVKGNKKNARSVEKAQEIFADLLQTKQKNEQDFILTLRESSSFSDEDSS